MNGDSVRPEHNAMSMQPAPWAAIGNFLRSNCWPANNLTKKVKNYDPSRSFEVRSCHTCDKKAASHERWVSFQSTHGKANSLAKKLFLRILLLHPHPGTLR